MVLSGRHACSSRTPKRHSHKDTFQLVKIIAIAAASFILFLFSSSLSKKVFDNYDTMETYEGDRIKISLWDTAGQEEFDKLRPLSYPQTDVFLVCFSVVDSTSYDNIAVKWISEIKNGEPNAPIVNVV